MVDNDDIAMDIDGDETEINTLIGGEMDTTTDLNLTGVTDISSSRNSFTYADDGPIPIDSNDNSWLDCLVFGKSDNLNDKSITPRSSTEMPIGSTGGSGSSKKRPFENINNEQEGGPKNEAKSFWDSCVSGRSQVYGGTPTSMSKKKFKANDTKQASNNRMCDIFFGSGK